MLGKLSQQVGDRMTPCLGRQLLKYGFDGFFGGLLRRQTSPVKETGGQIMFRLHDVIFRLPHPIEASFHNYLIFTLSRQRGQRLLAAELLAAVRPSS